MKTTEAKREAIKRGLTESELVLCVDTGAPGVRFGGDSSGPAIVLLVGDPVLTSRGIKATVRPERGARAELEAPWSAVLAAMALTDLGSARRVLFE